MRVAAVVLAVAAIAAAVLVTIVWQGGAMLHVLDPPVRASARAAPAVVAAAARPPRACAVVRDRRACADWHASRDGGRRGEARARPVACAANCSGVGTCDGYSGACTCPAGTRGRACELASTRACNGETDGLWVASHCAGECDASTGFCYCPGRVGLRPLPENCQPSHLTLEAFAAIGLRPDPASAGLSPKDGSVLVAAASDARGRAGLSDTVRTLTRDLLARPEQRANVLRRLWYGRAPSAAAVVVAFRTGDAPPGGPGLGAVGGVDSAVPYTVGARPPRPAHVSKPHLDPIFRRISARRTLPPSHVLHRGAPTAPTPGGEGASLGARIETAPPAWCEAEGAERPAARCACTYDGFHGPLCEARHEPFCLNQCSGHGRCAPPGGRCACDAGYFGVDCSLVVAAGAVVLHAAHAARLAPRAPSVFVYEFGEGSSLLLQLRADKRSCAHRHFNADETTAWSGYTYAVEVLLHEQLLASAHRTASPASADWFYVPVYASCLILPVYDYVGPGPWARSYPMRPVSAMRLFADALEHVRGTMPYWNASAGADHVFLFAHDEGGCWAPAELARNAILLSHWGRTDEAPDSSSRYMADNWQADHRTDTRSPAGGRWRFPGGSRAMIGSHPCHVPGKDIVIPVFAPPDKWHRSPWLKVAQQLAQERAQARARARPADGARAVSTADTAAAAPSDAAADGGGGGGDGDRPPAALLAEAERSRRTLAYFSGNLALHEPLKYARGVRHRLWAAFNRTAGWLLVGGRGGGYSSDLSDSEFCLVPPGGDGWSSRLDDAVRHGCIPVVIMDGVRMPWEELLDFDAYALRIAQADIERADDILRAIPRERRVAMRLAMWEVWTRFVYGRALTEAAFLGAPGRLPARHAEQPPLPALRLAMEVAGAGEHVRSDAFDTLMMTLAARKRPRRRRKADAEPPPRSGAAAALPRLPRA